MVKPILPPFFKLRESISVTVILHQIVEESQATGTKKQGKIPLIPLPDFLIMLKQKCLGPEHLKNITPLATSCRRMQLVRMRFPTENVLVWLLQQLLSVPVSSWVTVCSFE